MTCSIPDCNDPVSIRGWCQHHYNRWNKYGDPLAPLKNNTTPVTCSIEGCERIAAAKGWCPMHYRRDFLHGDPLYDSRQRPKRPYTKKPATQRFWAKVDKDGPVAPGMDSPCWLWTHSQRGGYGSFSHDGKNTAAHRFSYSISKGPIPHGYVIDHQCHTTLCVNPDHLRAITQKQNSENRRGAQSRNVTGVRGVSFVKGKYVGHVGHHGKVIYVGTHDTVEDAAAAVLAKRLELYTHNDEDLQFFQKTGENNLA